MFISLGRNCDVAYNIKHFTPGETNFFDWTRTDFKCVLYILNLKNIDTLLNAENIIIDKKLDDISILFKNFEKDNLTLLFHHDIIVKEYSVQEMSKQISGFIDKYKRRYDRLINLIKTDNKIYFIYHITAGFDYNDCELFDQYIKNINTNINYMLVLLVEEPETTDYILCKNKNCLKINITHFLNKNIPFDWTRSCYDWKSIFDIIKNN
jgi:hypothetical protein